MVQGDHNSIHLDEPPQGSPEPHHAMTRDRVYVFTDWAGSLDFKRRRGDTVGERKLAEHDALFRECLKRCGGAENKDTGDGFLATFGDAAGAVRFALDFQRGISRLVSPEPLSCRVGIHSGRAYAVENPPEATNREKLVGVDVDLTARIMQLAQPGQILMTRGVFDSARATLSPGEAGEAPRWLAHGAYLLDGGDETVDIFEAGIEGMSPLGAPPDSAKMKRDVAPGEAAALGWRPSIGGAIPGRPGWRLSRRLGQGGIGEVWLAEDESGADRRAFKFCFSSSRLRLLRREHTLSRLLTESLGECRSIAPLKCIQLESAPFWLEMDYFPEGDLVQWAERQGGIERVAFEVRLELAAQVAEALGRAHSAGVLHKDLKPRNILIRIDGGRPEAVLSDFGIGALLDMEALDSAGITASGFTRTASGETQRTSSGYGTHLYMAPEQLAGRPASIQSDVYGVGVLLFQLVVGDFGRPLGSGWERAVADPVLREDIGACVEGDPAERLADAAGLARRLRALPERRANLEAAERERRRAEKSARRFRALAYALAASVFLGVVLGAFLFIEHRRKLTETELRQQAQSSQAAAEYEAYLSHLQAADAWVRRELPLKAEGPLLMAPSAHRAWEWGHLMRLAHPEVVTLAAHSGAVRGAKFSPDEKRIVTFSKDHTARLWDFESGREVAVLSGHSAWVNFAEFSRDAARLLTAADDNTAKCWSAADGRLLFTLEGHLKPVNRARFSPDGTKILTASDDGTARIWNAADGSLLLRLEGHSDFIFEAEFSPDGLTVGTASDDDTAAIWSVETGRRLLTFSGHTDDVNDIEFSPDGTKVLTASNDKTARIWDPQTGRELLPPRSHPHLVRLARFSPDGRQCVTMSSESAYVWNSESGTHIAQLSTGLGIDLEDARFSGDGSKMIVAGKDRALRIWDIASQKQVAFFQHEEFVVSCDVSRDQAFVLTASGNLARVFPLFWSPGYYVSDETDMSVGWSPDNSELVVGMLMYKVVVFSAWGARPPRQWIAHSSRVNDAQFSPDGKRIVSASEDGLAKVWDSESAAELARFEGHKGVVRKGSFSPDGLRVATASDDGTAKVWDAADGREIYSLASDLGWMFDARFSPDGSQLLTAAGDGTARLWDAATGAPLRTFPAHGAEVLSARFSADGERVLTASGDSTARIFDAESGEEMLRISSGAGGFTDALFTADRRRVITGGSKDAAKVWDASNGRELLSIDVLGFFDVRALALSPDGSKLAGADIWPNLTIREAILWADLPGSGGDDQSVRERLWAWQRTRFGKLSKKTRDVNDFHITPPITLEPKPLR